MFYSILIIWITIDLFSKYLANLYLQERINLLGDFLYLKYAENTWIAFSIQVPLLFLKILTISLIIWIFYYYKKEIKVEMNEKVKKMLNISFALILAWAIGNAYERVFNEKVIDFIGVKYFSIFNIADSFIFVWAIFYIYIYYKINKLWVSDQKK